MPPRASTVASAGKIAKHGDAPIRAVRGLRHALAVGERVFLRRPASADRAEHIALRRSSRQFLERWEPKPPPGMNVFGDTGFDRLLKGLRSPSGCKMFICCRVRGDIMGMVNLNQIARGPFQSCLMGYWIGRAFSRQGFMTEAVRLAVGYAFGPLGLHRVEANIMPRNRASRALIQACGFRFEGLAKRYLQINGTWEDHQHWAITADEWPVRKWSPST